MNKRKRSTKKFKLDAVSLVLEQGFTRAQAVKNPRGQPQPVDALDQRA